MNKILKWWISLKSPWDDDFSPHSQKNANNEEENIFLRARKKPKNILPPDFNFNFNMAPNIVFMIIGVLFCVWLASGVYEVKEGEEAIIIRFGKFVRNGTAGLNYRMPYPIEQAVIEKVNQSRRIEIGYRSGVASRGNMGGAGREIAAESTMLTGDENIVYLNCDVMWNIKNLEDYVFNVVNPEDAVKTAAESAIREVIGKTPIASVLSNQKQEIADKIEGLTQKILDQYKVGVQVAQVQLLKAEPPSEVIDAYRDVQTAKADKEREINQAQAYNNDILPKARGEAAKLLQEAEGYKQEVISRAEGDVSRFNAILVQYQNSKQVTKDRLYLDAVSEVLGGAKKVITDSGVLPHMAIKGQGAALGDSK